MEVTQSAVEMWPQHASHWPSTVAQLATLGDMGTSAW